MLSENMTFLPQELAQSKQRHFSRIIYFCKPGTHHDGSIREPGYKVQLTRGGVLWAILTLVNTSSSARIAYFPANALVDEQVLNGLALSRRTFKSRTFGSSSNCSVRCGADHSNRVVFGCKRIVYRHSRGNDSNNIDERILHMYMSSIQYLHTHPRHSTRVIKLSICAEQPQQTS